MSTTSNGKGNNSKPEGKQLVVDDTVYKTNLTQKFMDRNAWEKPDAKKMVAFIPGTILKVYAKKGQSVKRGEKLLVLEAMKMKNRILAMKPGKISGVHVKEGDVVTKGQLLVTFA